VGAFTISRFEVRYAEDWQPIEAQLEGIEGPKAKDKATVPIRLATSFAMTTAINEITQNATTNSKTDQISARSVVLVTNVFAGYEALAARLATAAVGAEIPTYVAPLNEVKVTVKGMTEETVKTPGGVVRTRKFALNVPNAKGGSFTMTVGIDDNARLARIDLPPANISVVRSDLAGVSARTLTARNPTDSDVTMPANGFTLAGTLTRPNVTGRLRLPAVVLVGGPGGVDRDNYVAGIPIMSQLAGSLAEQGYLVLRYDKRAVGQSGGRSETATQRDYADDLVGIVKWLAKRDDVDSRRIAVVGYSEGGMISMLAADRENKIGSLVLMATPGTTGADLVLEQQQRELERLGLPTAERDQKIALQKQIQAAVVSDTGWEALGEDVRKQANTPWFRSFLLSDPAAILQKIKQPILVLQGDLDTQVSPQHADKLGELARARKKGAGAVEVVHLAGVNHLMVPATTGEVSEYPELKTKTISPEVTSAIVGWLKKSQP
jgi:pimeloyl-ACP methyl ester carboxylesterase